MILTLTPNPSVDRTLFIPELTRGGVTRSLRYRSEPSGKGVNVSLALASQGHATRAVFPAGGYAGLQIRQMLLEAHIDHVATPIEDDIRSNISLVEPSGTVTKVNEIGPVVTVAESDLLLQAAYAGLEEAAWLAACGSLPSGMPEDLYAGLIDTCHERGVKIAVDAWGAPLRRALPHGPDLVAPNVLELADTVGRSMTTVGDVLDCAEFLRKQGARAVLASLGPDGAMLVDDDGAHHGESPVESVVSAVGAGDALLAGFLSAGGEGTAALAVALQWAAAAVQHEETLFSTADPTRTFIHDDIDCTRKLVEPVSLPTEPQAP